MHASAAHSVLLCVTPSIPSSLDSGIDELEPLILSQIVRRRRQSQHLPPSFIANHRHHRLPPWPSNVAIGPRALWVRGHQALLHCEDEIVRSPKCRGRHRRVVPA
jgi:hypothetical protein